MDELVSVMVIYRILAYCKAIARNILKYIKRSEYHLILKKKNSNYRPMPHEIYTRQKLEELCKFPKGKIDACNEMGDFYELSIIVPAYNVEQYIEKCVESILNQKTKYKFELIIVNDGSTDNTYSIIQQYKNRKNVVIINQENGGHSSARNSALKHINGKYLMFVDSDDYILPGAIDALLDKAIQNNADMVEGSAFSFYDNGKISRFFRHWNSLNSISPIDTFYGYPWGKVIKSVLFSDIKFPDGFWFEDTLFVMILYPKATNSYTIKKEVYAYRVNMSGITQTAKKNFRSIESLWITEYLMGEQKKRNLLSESTYNQFFDQIAMNDARVRQLGNDVRKMVFEESVRLYQLYYKNCFFSIHSEKAKKLHNYIIAFNEEMALTLLENWNYL